MVNHNNCFHKYRKYENNKINSSEQEISLNIFQFTYSDKEKKQIWNKLNKIIWSLALFFYEKNEGVSFVLYIIQIK